MGNSDPEAVKHKQIQGSADTFTINFIYKDSTSAEPSGASHSPGQVTRFLWDSPVRCERV